MQFTRTRNAAGNPIVPAKLQDSTSSAGAGLPLLTFASSGLKIAVKRELDAAWTLYSSAGSTIENITTIGTYVAPTATKIRFKPTDDTNAPGDYELHLAQALLGTGDASRYLRILIWGATNLAPCDILIQLDANDASDVYTRLGAPAGVSTAADIAGVPAAVLTAASAAPIAADAKKMNGTTVQGNGTAGNLWRG